MAFWSQIKEKMAAGWTSWTLAVDQETVRLSENYTGCIAEYPRHCNIQLVGCILHFGKALHQPVFDGWIIPQHASVWFTLYHLLLNTVATDLYKNNYKSETNVAALLNRHYWFALKRRAFCFFMFNVIVFVLSV